jgi:virulence-associated protein VapD
MTRDDIIRMARKAGFADAQGTVHAAYQLEHFAALVATAEREACAKVCQEEIDRVKPLYSVVAENAMKAIRARGQA